MRQIAYVVIKEKRLSAEIDNGEVVGWKPITLDELNADIDQCIDYLEDIRSAIEKSRE